MGGWGSEGVWKLKNNIQKDKPAQIIYLHNTWERNGTFPTSKRTFDEFASELGAASARTLSQFQMHFSFLQSTGENKYYLI